MSTYIGKYDQEPIEVTIEDNFIFDLNAIKIGEVYNDIEALVDNDTYLLLSDCISVENDILVSEFNRLAYIQRNKLRLGLVYDIKDKYVEIIDSDGLEHIINKHH